MEVIALARRSSARRLGPIRGLSSRGLSLRGLSTIATLAPQLHHLKLSEQRFTLLDSTPVSAAARHLLDSRLTFALVVDESNAAVGLASEHRFMEYVTHAGMGSFFKQGATTEEPTIAEWMTRVDDMLFVKLDDEIEHAAQLFANVGDAGTFRHLPVLDYWGKLHSVLDVRDVITHAIGNELGMAAWKGKTVADVLGEKRKLSVAGGAADAPDLPWRDQLEAYLLDHARSHTISARRSVEEAAKQMLQTRLTFLVVIEPGLERKDDRVLGLVNERSFLPFCASGAATNAGAKAPVHRAVMTVMTPLAELLSVSLTDPIEAAIDTFYAHNVRHVPVIDKKGRLAGIVSARDLLRPLLQARAA